ncbi:hypothetical protein Bca52824_037201 [Brassica carinata]|uniref:Uncharacterized protein n=1 Tax=Brassica carinata TaxID=52824 RepID=A0A8X7SB03_BRACI|nr:hypothetical protein Bca52824_037201 [Brassica carinata]
MVSQSAGQTRFRTFKYENNGAVVVRAIVCFQPMANCQAEYFRHMLKPVTYFIGLNCKSMPLDNSQQKWLPLGLNPQDIATGSSSPGAPFPELGKIYASEYQFRYLQPPFQALLSSYGTQVAAQMTLKSSQKRFLVFDHSFSSFVATDPEKILNFLSLEKGLSKDHAIPEKIFLHEDHVNGEEEESEMHEDTEEINALLYSDDEDNDDCESDDEVTSTGHSPFPVEQQACNNKTEEELDETESCGGDDGPRLKRQKVLLDHSSYREDLSPSPSPSPSPSFVVGTKSLTNLKRSSDEKLQESNISSSNQEMGSGLSDEEETRKDKFHTALRILESVVPGAQGKEALYY